MGARSSIEPVAIRHPIIISLWTLPEIRILHVTKVGRQAPISSSIVRDALQPYFIVELVRQLYLTCVLGAGAAISIFLAYSNIDEVFGAEFGFTFGNWNRGRRWRALVHFASSVLIVVPQLFKEGNGAAVVEVGEVWLGVEILLCNVAVVCCFEPVPARVIMSAIFSSR